MFLSKEEWKKKVQNEDKDYIKRKVRERMENYLRELVIDVARCYGNEENRNELWKLRLDIIQDVKEHSKLLRNQIFFCEELLKKAFYEDGIVI